jgi:hypothetical protein
LNATSTPGEATDDCDVVTAPLDAGGEALPEHEASAMIAVSSDA